LKSGKREKLIEVDLMPYSYVTLTQAQAELSLRLFDTTQQFWSAAELTLYIQESLRTFQALSNFWRNDFVFPTQANVTWYDLTTVANTLRSINVTDQQLYTTMEFHLLEPVATNFPAVGQVWTGSKQFTIQDLINAVQRRRDEILSVSGCTITLRTVPAVPGRTSLPDTVIDIRRGAFLPQHGFGGVASPLWMDDVWAEQAFENSYLQSPAGTPQIMAVSSQPPLSFDVDIQPNIPGTYELLTIEAGGGLSVVAASTLLIPDDWTWVLKWGALADLFSRESNGKDELRAQYCEARYRQGLELLTNASALLAMRLNNVPLNIDSVYNADAFNQGWQGVAASQPDTALVSGLNLVALSPKPDAGPYSVTATVAQNAPIPSVGTDPVQVGRDEYDAVIGYAQHLAAFKMGGAEMMATAPLLERFLLAAQVYNSKLIQSGEFMKVIYGLSSLQKKANPEQAVAPE
jgi:hypothetical protein